MVVEVFVSYGTVGEVKGLLWIRDFFVTRISSK